MQIEVRLYATLRRYAPVGSVAGVFSVAIPEESSVADLLKVIQISFDEIHMLMVNGVGTNPEQVLREGDRVGLFPPVGGG